MWNSVRESVRHATEDLDKFLDIRRRNTDDSSGKCNGKNAMKNVVTPQSIPAFTVPPLLSSCANGFREEEDDDVMSSKTDTKVDVYTCPKSSSLEKGQFLNG